MPTLRLRKPPKLWPLARWIWLELGLILPAIPICIALFWGVKHWQDWLGGVSAKGTHREAVTASNPQADAFPLPATQLGQECPVVPSGIGGPGELAPSAPEGGLGAS